MNGDGDYTLRYLIDQSSCNNEITWYTCRKIWDCNRPTYFETVYAVHWSETSY